MNQFMQPIQSAAITPQQAMELFSWLPELIIKAKQGLACATQWFW
jgi:hypothetical protein